MGRVMLDENQFTNIFATVKEATLALYFCNPKSLIEAMVNRGKTFQSGNSSSIPRRTRFIVKICGT